MAFCRQCGEQIPDNDSFCIYCGSPQGDFSTTGSEAGFNKLNISAQLNDSVNAFLGLLNKPISSIRIITRKEVQSTATLAGVLVLLFGLLGMWCTNRVVSTTMGIFGGLLGGLGNMLSYGESNFSPEIPYGLVFGHSLLLILAVIGGLFLGMWLTGKYIFKASGEVHQYFNVAAASRVPFITALIAGLILSYISIYLGMMAVIMGAIVSLVCVYTGLQEITGIDEDRLVYGLCLSYVSMYLFVFIILKIFMSA